VFLPEEVVLVKWNKIHPLRLILRSEQLCKSDQ